MKSMSTSTMTSKMDGGCYQSIKILKTGINVKKVVDQLKKYPGDWDHQKSLEGSQSLLDRGFADLPVSALQLIIGGVKHKDDFVGDSEINIKTPAYAHHSEIRKIIRKHFKNADIHSCLLYTSPSPRDRTRSRMPSSA